MRFAARWAGFLRTWSASNPVLKPPTPFFQYLSIALLAFVVSSLLIPLMIRLALRFGVVDKPNQRKVHTAPKPLLGGLAIFIGYSACFALILGMYVAPDHPVRGTFVALYLSSMFLLLVGLIDDIRGLAATTKLVCQICAASVMIYMGVRIRFWLEADWMQYLVTLVWFVVITNAFNLLDHMDGLSGGVASLTAFLYFLLTVFIGEREYGYLLLALTFSIIGFLKYNFYPSKLFMGDTGSLFIGFNLAAFSAMVTYLGYGPASHMPTVTPLVIFAVPLYDTASVIWIRIKEGRSIFQADKYHFSHRLVALGMTHRQAVAVILLLTFAVGLMAVLLPKLSGAQGMLVLSHTVCIFAVIALLERSSSNKMRALGINGAGAAGKEDKGDVENRRPQ